MILLASSEEAMHARRWIPHRARECLVKDHLSSEVLGRALEEAVHGANLEDQLRQAQKMEAIGRLAGGVAHDFNNILTTILGYSELVMEGMGQGDPLREDLMEIHRAAERGAVLTRQLLTLGRRQTLTPQVLDLNLLLTQVKRMLQRVIGEDIELVVDLGSDVGFIRADPSQIEQVILNLVVNARDAMPEGGRLSIRTDRVELDEEFVRSHLGSATGPHARLSVSDTGWGLSAEAKAHLFEPFFTTKEPGKGTGLGLPTAYGIVRQSGGFIEAESEPGRGTTFRMYLPRAVPSEERQGSKTSSFSLKRGNETILLVEDEEPVRLLLSRVLRNCGHQVLEAECPSEALKTCREYPGTIDLLLTDVVMPQASGFELAALAQSQRPRMKVLCMSGHAEHPSVRRGIEAYRGELLQKPFTSEALLRKIRKVLDAGAIG
jgi:signal transduction histidine kinase/ActR/RegA family two-component response regulator